MAELLAVAARLRAVEKGQAVRIAAAHQVMIQPHALVLTMLAMAGEDTSVHAVAVGGLGEPAEVNAVADPRRRDDQYALLRWLLPRFEDYFALCREQGTFPQIWVASGSSLGHLDTLADRLRFTDDPDVQRLGTLWTYATERSPVVGQQALMSATAALRAHYATGQQESEDEHLGTLLTWIDPPAGRDIFAAVAMAEAQPMGVKTDPRFDRDELQPLVEQFNKARSRAEPPEVIARHELRVSQSIERVIRPIYAATQAAIALLRGPDWPDNPALAELVTQEAQEFESFMASRDAGYFLPYHDSPKAGAFKIVARERAVATAEMNFVRHDRAARERGAVHGSVLRVAVRDVETIRHTPHLSDYRVTLESAQDSLHLRSGDIVSTLDAPNVALRLDAVARSGGVTRIIGLVTEGKRVAKNLTTGTMLDLGPAATSAFLIIQERGQMALRLTNTPWTHGEVVPAARPTAAPRPANMLAAVEALT